jgi:hypothetical protein
MAYSSWLTHHGLLIIGDLATKWVRQLTISRKIDTLQEPGQRQASGLKAVLFLFMKT